MTLANFEIEIFKLMKRKSFIKNSSFALFALAISKGKSLSSLMVDPAYTIEMITADAGIFLERGGTILFMLGKKGIVVIDAQFPDTAGHCITALKEKSSTPFQYLINTHHHGDHTAGNIAFKGMVEHVAAHMNSLKNQTASAEKAKSTDKQLFPDLTFDGKAMYLRKANVKLHYFGRGHTDGDSYVQLRAQNIVHVGDQVFNRRHPFIDRTAGANITEWIATLDKATKKFKGDTTYVCGHAGEGHKTIIKKADILAFRTYLQNLLAVTEAAITAGTSKEDFLKTTKTIAGSPEWKGDGIERPLTAAWEELTTGKKD